MKHFFHRHQPSAPLREAGLHGLGAMLAIALLGALSFYTGNPLLIAPFGASCVLLFSVPDSALAQPANVVGGHIVATAIALAMHALLPNEWWAVALAVGISISAMSLLRITHPPAGADPIVVFAADPAIAFLVFPITIGAVGLVLIACLFHAGTRKPYPLRRAE